jgi:hypothetical protein
MRQNTGLLTQHVSSISMPIFRSTLVSTAFWCPKLILHIFYDARSHEHKKCGEFLDVLNNEQLARNMSATHSALCGLNNHS